MWWDYGKGGRVLVEIFDRGVIIIPAVGAGDLVFRFAVPFLAWDDGPLLTDFCFGARTDVVPVYTILKSIRVHLSPGSSCGILVQRYTSLWDIQLSFDW